MYQTQPKYKQKNTLFIVSSSTGKERDSETGFSYFGARYYDSDILTGWLSVDPLADKYPSLSPYNYCALNPIRVVDPNGDSCAVLLAGDRLGGLGHMGILIQRKKDGTNNNEFEWVLYSKNGEDGNGNVKTILNKDVGTKNDNPGKYPETTEIATFGSIEEFLNSDYNTLNHNGDGPKYYTDAFLLPTTEMQDIIISNEMENILKQNYNLLNNNCSEAVVSALNKAGIRTLSNTNNVSNSFGKGMVPRLAFYKIVLANFFRGKMI